ncbi:MAG: uridine kinase [Candidatus Latescibacterota bacterium]
MKRNPSIIGIAGASCSGKTLLANAIAQAIPAGDAAVIGLDSYYLDRAEGEQANLNFDDPAALEKELLIEQLQMLSNGESIEKPVYDYVSHGRQPQTELIQALRYIIIEGLHTLHWREIRSLLRLKVFIDVDHDTCLARRIARDTKERGRTRASIMQQYRETVRPMYDRFVYPTQKYADLLLDGSASVEDLTAILIGRLDL